MRTTADPAPAVTAAPGSDRTRQERGRARAALALLVSAQFVVMLDTSIVNVALPSIQRELGTGTAGLAWVVNAYFLGFGGLLLVSGRAADVLGRRRTFLLGSAAFALATLVAGLATETSVLVAARAAQGVAAAVLSPSAMSLLLVRFPGTARARAMSAWGAASTLGGATGVLTGGVVTQAFGWSWVFFVTVPVSVVALVAGPRLLPVTTPVARRSFDGLGAVTVTGAALALVWAALAVPEHGWTGLPTLVGAAVAAVLLAAFVVVERRAEDPLVPLVVLRSPVVSAGVALSLLGGAARASTFVLVALHLQQVLQLAPRSAGLAMVPTSLAGFAVSLALLPRVLRRYGAERTLTGGLLLLAAGHLWIVGAPVAAGYARGVLPALLLVAVGVALSFTPTTMVVASGLPADRAGLASGLAGASTQVGAALGISAFAAAAASRADGLDGMAAAAAGSQASFTAAAVVALAAAGVGAGLVRRTRGHG